MNLNNYCQNNRIRAATYNTGHTGTQHSGTWTSTVTVNGSSYTGDAMATKQAAEDSAADKALKVLQG
ncbi:hypothetical protein SCHPADRAFT_940586 [Schizopora paradoxa]|uniref:DRBM domain-containing protein n=1 Tax=Schizopora paradoxa TaxID=27342 RepID=A0A0H2RNM7_9AGAM|nr:hypothetical protein SCHPADRAFT_940586 [Schizopora paradoxa]